jgi:transcriptional regulator with XRE-family HTH domain
MRKSIHSAQYAVLLELLAEARSRTNLTQIDLAKRLKMTQSSVSKVERGERRLDVIELHAWCQALGTPFRTMMSDLDNRLSRHR